MKRISTTILLITSIISMGWSQNSNLTIEPYVFESKSGEKIDAELGTFSVLENRLASSSRTLDIKFVRFKSTNPNPGNPIVYLAGGPGGSGIRTAMGNRFELFMALRTVADVIALDQRGTGLSNQIPDCPTNARFALEEPGIKEVYVSKMSTAAKTCLEFWKQNDVDISGYNTAQSADDLDDLRKALKVEKISLWGISYGSHLAFDFIKRYEDKLDKVILAGLEGPDQTIKLPAYNQNYLERLEKAVLSDEAAAKAYPNLLAMMKTVLDRLEANPFIVDIDDRRSGKSVKVGISKLDVQLVTSFFLTKNPSNASQLPYLFAQMESGDFTEIGQMVAMLKMYAGRSQAMPMAMDAMSGVSEKRWMAIQEQSKSALLGRTTNFPYPDLGKELGLPDLGESFRENPKTNVSALFFSGSLDGRTYLESAEELVSGFANGSHVILKGAGHDSFMSTPRVKELMLRFLNGESVDSQTIDIPLPAFKLPATIE